MTRHQKDWMGETCFGRVSQTSSSFHDETVPASQNMDRKLMLGYALDRFGNMALVNDAVSMHVNLLSFPFSSASCFFQNKIRLTAIFSFYFTPSLKKKKRSTLATAVLL